MKFRIVAIPASAGYISYMKRKPTGPFASTRNYGTVIAVYTESSPIATALPLNHIANMIAAGTGLRVGVIYASPQPRTQRAYLPAEALLAASNGAAGRLMGVKPMRRVVNRPPGVDWFAPRLTTALARQDWFDIYQEARSSRGVLILVDPEEDIYRDITVIFGEQLIIEECGRKYDYPDPQDGWKDIAVILLHTMVAVRALFIPPCDGFGIEAIFGSPMW